jgi:manganese/zinc/iron transport system permease protein
MLVIAAVAGIFSSVTSYYFAVWLDGSIAGAIATFAGVFFGLALLFSPAHGLLFKKLRATQLTFEGKG